MNYKNLTIIGTSHIAQQSINDITKAFEEMKPEIVVLELDKNRLYGLIHGVKKVSFKDMGKLGFAGFIFALIGSYAQKKLGNIVGVAPGSDMLAAFRMAKKHNSQIYLVDQDVRITLKRLSKEFTFREKMRVISDIFMGIFFKKRELKKYGINNFDLKKVPEKRIIEKMLKAVKKRYPNLYKVLVEERNDYMASKIARLMYTNNNKKIVAVVGAGHEDDLINLIQKKRIDIIN